MYPKTESRPPPTSRLAARILSLGSAVVLSLAVFVVGHNLTFLIAYGSGYAAEMARLGDGTSWNDTATVVLGTATLLAALAVLRLGALLWQVRAVDRARRVRPSAGVYWPILLSVWLRLFSAATILFLIQENFERWSAGLPLAGLSVLGAVGSVNPIPVFALVSLAFALVVALFRLSVDRLEAVIAGSRIRTWARASGLRPARALESESAPISVIARNLAGRAPPDLLAA